MKSKEVELTVGELLKLYPDGFCVGPLGTISKTVFASSHFMAIANNHPFPPSNGGYLVIEMVGNEGNPAA